MRSQAIRLNQSAVESRQFAGTGIPARFIQRATKALQLGPDRAVELASKISSDTLDLEHRVITKPGDLLAGIRSVPGLEKMEDIEILGRLNACHALDIGRRQMRDIRETGLIPEPGHLTDVPSSRKLTQFDLDRFELIRKNASSDDEFYDPHMVQLNITRRCLSNGCAHCATDATPLAPERLNRIFVRRFIEGLEVLPIFDMYVMGGEPMLMRRLANEALSLGIANELISRFHLESNLFWADTPERADKIMGQLASLGFEENNKTLILAGNTDRFHRCHVPFESLFNAMTALYQHFPNGVFGLSHTLKPGDTSQLEFLEFLRDKGVLEEADVKKNKDGSRTVNSFTVNHEGSSREVDFCNIKPVLVGRGRELRGTPYDEWIRASSFAPSLHQEISKLYDGTDFPDMLALGWDGLLYHHVMFMHTQTYPVGDIRTDDPAEVVERVNRDPLLRRLQEKGYGSIYRAAVHADPTVKEIFANCSSIVQAAIDTLSDPERNAKILESIIGEDRSICALRSKHVKPAPNEKAASEAIDKILEHDWTGIEHALIGNVAEVLSTLAPEEAVKLLKEKDCTGSEYAILFTLVMHSQSPDALFRAGCSDSALVAKFSNSVHLADSSENVRALFLKYLEYAAKHGPSSAASLVKELSADEMEAVDHLFRHFAHARMYSMAEEYLEGLSAIPEFNFYSLSEESRKTALRMLQAKAAMYSILDS